MKYFWPIIAAACMCTAATFFWLQRTDIAFVTATLGVVAWFLNYRRQQKQIVDERDEETERLLDDSDET